MGASIYRFLIKNGVRFCSFLVVFAIYGIYGIYAIYDKNDAFLIHVIHRTPLSIGGTEIDQNRSILLVFAIFIKMMHFDECMAK